MQEGGTEGEEVRQRGRSLGNQQAPGRKEARGSGVWPEVTGLCGADCSWLLAPWIHQNEKRETGPPHHSLL